MVHNNRGLPICCCLFSPHITELTSGKAAEPPLEVMHLESVSLPSVEDGVLQVSLGKEQEMLHLVPRFAFRCSRDTS